MNRQDLIALVKNRGMRFRKNLFLKPIGKKLFILRDGKLFSFPQPVSQENIKSKFPDLTEEYALGLAIISNNLELEPRAFGEDCGPQELFRELYLKSSGLGFPMQTNISFECKLSTGSVHKKEIVLAKVYKHKEEEFVRFFGEEKSPHSRPVSEQYDFTGQFYQYFTIVNGINYTIFSPFVIKESLVRLEGTCILVDDTEKLSTSNHCETTKKHFVFVNGFQNIRLNRKKILSAIKLTNSKEDLKNHYFGVLRQPSEFEDIVLAWNIHKVPENSYPLHLNIISRGGLGKTSLLEKIMKNNSLDTQNIFSGSSNTPKGLYPSFKGDTVKPGYFLEQSHIACVDEIYEMLDRVQRNTEKDELFNKLRELFEWKSRTLMSGNTEDSISRPTFRAITVGNPPQRVGKGIDECGTDMASLQELVDVPWLMRVLTIFYTKEHEDFIHSNKQKVAISQCSPSIELADYLKALSELELDLSLESKKRINTLIDYPKYHAVFQDKLILGKNYPIFLERGIHHINCLADGIIKMNHLEEINAVLPKLLRKKKPIMTIELSEKDIEDLKILIDYVLWTWFESKNRVNRDFARKISEEKRQLVKTLQTNASV